MPKIVQNYKEQARELILLAAIKEFSKNGYRETTMSQIAKNVGVTKGNLYHYFPNKSALLREMALTSRSSFLKTLYQGISASDSIEAVVDVCVTVLDQEAAGAQLWFDILSESFIDREIRNLVKEQFEEYIRTVKAALDRLPKKLGDYETKLDENSVAMAIMFLLTGAHTSDSLGISRPETIMALKTGLSRIFGITQHAK